MSNTVIKEELVKNSNQPQQKEKNIDSLIGEMNTFEIFKTDVENIFNSDYLKECVESSTSWYIVVHRGRVVHGVV